MTGYDPNASLLPSSGGTIQAMSGGGTGVPPTLANGTTYNQNATLLPNDPPSAGAVITPYRGGADGGDGPKPAAVSSSYGRITPAPAESTPVSVSKSAPTLAPAVLTPTPTSEPTSAPAPVTLNGTPLGEVSLAMTPGPGPMPVNPMVTVVQTEPAITITPPTEQAKEKPAEDKKTLVLFGITMELENPKRKNNTEDFTKNQKKVLADLGLDGPGVSFKQKRDILQTIYDEKCRTEQSLMMLQNCEPIRQIVQTLALQLLETLQPADMAAISVSEQDKPVVTFTKDEAKKTTTVSITFGPGQLQQLSAERPKNKGKNKNASKPKNKVQEKEQEQEQEPKKAEEPAPSPAKQLQNAQTATEGPSPAAEEKKEDAKSETGLVAAIEASTDSTSTDATQTESSIAQPSTAMSLAAEPSPDTKGGDVVTQIGIQNPAKVNCYCVSVAQMLFSLPEVRDAVESYECTIEKEKLTEEAVSKITVEDVRKQVSQSGRESVDPMFLCVLKQLFRALQARVTSLANPVSLDTAGAHGLSDIYTQYLMKVYVVTKEESITQQQDAAEYLNMIVEIFHANEHFQEVAEMFRYRVDTEIRCGDQTELAGPPKEQVSDPPMELKMPGYIDAPNVNKPTKNVVPLGGLIHFSERADERTNLKRCADGKGTKRDTYHITDENKYLVFYTNRFEFDEKTQKRVHREDLTLQAEPHLVVDNTSYHIHGAVLYGSHGTTGGHYVYLRVNDAGADDADNADKLPAILYNNEKVSDNKGDWTIASKSFLLVYRRQPEGHVSKAVKVAPEVVEKEGQEVETEAVEGAEEGAEVGAKEGQEVETEAVEGTVVEPEPISGLQPIPQGAAQGEATSTASATGILSQARSSSNISPSNDPNNPNNQNEPAAKKQKTEGGIRTLKTKLKKVQRTLQNRPSTAGGKKTQKHAKAKKNLSRKKKARRAKK